MQKIRFILVFRWVQKTEHAGDIYVDPAVGPHVNSRAFLCTDQQKNLITPRDQGGPGGGRQQRSGSREPALNR